MRYTVQGQIDISPPLTFAEIEASGLDIRDPWDTESTVRLRVDSQNVTTERGILDERTAAALIPIIEDPFKTDRLVDDIQAFVTAFAGTHQMSGTFDCFGDGNAAVRRVVVEGGQVRQVRLASLWPEDVADLRAAVEAERSRPEASLCTTFRAARALLIALDNVFERADRY